jgi:hypothetical protein
MSTSVKLEWDFETFNRWVAYAPNGSEFGHVSIKDDGEKHGGEFEVWKYQPRHHSSTSLTGSANPPTYPCLCSAKAAIEVAYLKATTKHIQTKKIA